MGVIICIIGPFMSLVIRHGFEYAGGGMGNIVPIYNAIQNVATELDIIVLKRKKTQKESCLFIMHWNFHPGFFPLYLTRL